MNKRKSLLIHFTEEDYTKIKEEADRLRIPMASYLRMLIFKQMHIEHQESQQPQEKPTTQA